MIAYNFFRKTISTFCLLSAVYTGILAFNTNPIPQPGDGSPQDSIGQVYQDFVKTFDKVFKVSPNHVVVLSNKYGKVTVQTGNSAQVVVKARITVVTNTQQEADRVFDRVNIAFLEGPNFVKAETNIETQNKAGQIWTAMLDTKTCDFHIDYEVWMPAANKLDIANRHGNTLIGNLRNSVKIDQKYGDVRLEGATSAHINLAYGGGQLCSLTSLTGAVSYGRLTSPNVKSVQLQTKNSQFKFDEIGVLNIRSSYDDYEINHVGNLNADSRFGKIYVMNVDNIVAIGSSTSFKILKLENSADIDNTYGNIRIGSVKNGFSNINIKGTRTDCVLAIAPSISYLLDLVGSNSQIQQPASVKTTVNRQEPYRREIMGVVGSNNNTKSVIRVRVSYGDFRIR